MINWKVFSVSVLVVAALGFVWGRSSVKPTTITKTETIEKEIVRKDIVTTIKEVKRPDGTIEKTETIIDKSKENKSIQKEYIALQAKKIDWAVGLQANFKGLKQDSYSLSLDRRILGPLFLTVSGNTDLGASIGIKYEF